MKGVKHIPNLRKNFILIGKLTIEGYTTIFYGDYWKFSKDVMKIAFGKKSGTLYMIVEAFCSITIVASNDNSNLWHQRGGDMSEKKAKKLCIKMGDYHIFNQLKLTYVKVAYLDSRRELAFIQVPVLRRKRSYRGPTTISSISN